MSPIFGTVELLCSTVHPCNCDHAFCGRSVADVVAQACEHGAVVHGFTPCYYNAARVGAMTAAAVPG